MFNKRHIRELLINFVNLKKTAAEAHRLRLRLRSSEISWGKWFHKFKKDKFDLEDKERSGRPKSRGDKELETL